MQILIEDKPKHGARKLRVTRLDRLARTTRDLLNPLAAIADRKAMGRPPKLTPRQRREALRRRNRGTETLADIARSYNRQPGDDFEAGAMRQSRPGL